MQLVKFAADDGQGVKIGVVQGDQVVPFALTTAADRALSEILHARAGSPSPEPSGPAVRLDAVRLMPPIDGQEVWGAGVTYLRSKVARQEESEQGGSFYDQVYTADRPELFFKANPHRVVGHRQAIRVREDTSWCVPEPELALVLSPDLRLVGFTIGNDVSARDIEGRNPLYLPQAKVYDGCCALGPGIALAGSMPPTDALGIRMAIHRAGAAVFEGATSTNQLARRFDELIAWLGRDNSFPNGVILLTGTGIVPPDEFSLQPGDEVRIAIDGIGTLINPVVQGTVGTLNQNPPG